MGWDAGPQLDHPREFVTIARFWLDKGVAGFRLDAARYLVEAGRGPGQADQPETHTLWRRFRSELDKSHPGTLLIGEVWTELKTTVTYFGQADELQMVFDFDRMNALRKSVKSATSGDLLTTLCRSLGALPANNGSQPGGLFGTFISHHDLHRQAGEITDRAGLRLIASLLLTLPGTPCLYYGEELGLTDGVGGDDPAKREPMRWSTNAPHHGFSTASLWHPDSANAGVAGAAEQSADEASLLSHYRRPVHLRRAHPALSAGATTVLSASGTGGSPVAWLRRSAAETVLVVANLGDKTATDVLIAGAGTLPAERAFQPILGLSAAVRTDRSGKICDSPASARARCVFWSSNSFPELPRTSSNFLE
ncbi:MAG: alpha-amylase [Myxococcota bacterium]